MKKIESWINNHTKADGSEYFTVHVMIRNEDYSEALHINSARLDTFQQAYSTNKSIVRDVKRLEGMQ